MALRAPLVLSLLLLAACPQPTRVAANAPSFSRQILPVFQQNCASARGCHGVSPVDWVDLSLEPDRAYSQLVNQPAAERDGMRVAPGNVEGSFLVAKLRGQLKPREGDRMPLDPATRRQRNPDPISAEFIEKTLVPWIEAGAPNN